MPPPAISGSEALAEFVRPLARHHYSAGAVGLFVQLVLSAATSGRAAAAVLELIAPLLPGPDQTPGANTGRLWLLRLGLHELTCEKEVADDWIWIMDHTLQLGSWKCLIIVGIRRSHWEDDRRPLEHEDVRLLGLEPMEHSSGQAVKEALLAAEEKTGAPRAIVSDGGSDLKRGVQLYREEGRQVAHVLDIKHKNALLLKKELEKDKRWASYVREANNTKLATTQTSLAFLTPPSLKTKGRYMNLDTLVEWGENVLRYLDDPRDHPEVEVDRKLVKKKLRWVWKYRRRLAQWSELLAVAQSSEHYVRHEGFHRNAADELREQLAPLATRPCSLRLQETVLQFVSEQGSQAEPGERLIGSSEVLESIIGKYKRLQGMHSKGGMTAMLLSIGAIVCHKTVDTIARALESVKTVEVGQWLRQQLGITIQAQRKIALCKEQKPDPKQLQSAESF